MRKVWVAYLRENLPTEKSQVYDQRTNYETGEQVLEFQIMLNHKKTWINALDCVVINKNTVLEE